jgi:hypothetical protein
MIHTCGQKSKKESDAPKKNHDYYNNNDNLFDFCLTLLDFREFRIDRTNLSGYSTDALLYYR